MRASLHEIHASALTGPIQYKAVPTRALLNTRMCSMQRPHERPQWRLGHVTHPTHLAGKNMRRQMADEGLGAGDLCGSIIRRGA